MGVAKALQDYDRPLETVLPLKYLGCLLTATDGDCPTIISNLGKAIKTWSQLARILGQEGTDTRTMGHYYVAIVRSSLLFGLETWILTHCIKRLLGDYHRQLSGNLP